MNRELVNDIKMLIQKEGKNYMVTSRLNFQTVATEIIHSREGRQQISTQQTSRFQTYKEIDKRILSTSAPQRVTPPNAEHNSKRECKGYKKWTCRTTDTP